MYVTIWTFFYTLLSYFRLILIKRYLKMKTGLRFFDRNVVRDSAEEMNDLIQIKMEKYLDI